MRQPGLLLTARLAWWLIYAAAWAVSLAWWGILPSHWPPQLFLFFLAFYNSGVVLSESKEHWRLGLPWLWYNSKAEFKKLENPKKAQRSASYWPCLERKWRKRKVMFKLFKIFKKERNADYHLGSLCHWMTQLGYWVMVPWDQLWQWWVLCWKLGQAQTLALALLFNYSIIR